MKITKDLLKIAHELDANGLYALADTIDSLAVKLAAEPSDILAPPRSTSAPVVQPKDNSKSLSDLAARDTPKVKTPGPARAPMPVDLPKDFSRELRELAARDTPKASTRTLDSGPEIKDLPAEQGRPRTPSDWSESAQKAEREIHKERMKLDKKLRAEFDKELRKSPGWDKANAAQRKEIIEAAKARVRGAMANLQEGARSVGEVAGKAKAYRADPGNSWKTGLKGAKPGMVSGLLGGAVGTHAGATIGEAIGGDTGGQVGGVIGGVAGVAVAGTPLGRALLAGWTIGTIINEAGLGDVIQKSLFAGEDASMEAEQLKGMIDIFDKTAQIIDHSKTPVEKKAQKILNIENLVNRIIEHPASSSVLGSEGLAKFETFKQKMHSTVAQAAASAPAAEPSNAASVSPPAATPTRKMTSSPAIRELQKNLNKLYTQGSIELAAPLVVDGIAGPKTRAALLAAYPDSGGRVTTEAIDFVSQRVNYKNEYSYG